MHPLDATSLARAQPAARLHLPDTPDAETLVEASRQLGLVNTARLAQDLVKVAAQDPERGATLRDVVAEMLPPLDRASFERQLLAALPPDTPAPRPGPLTGTPLRLPATPGDDAATVRSAVQRVAQAFAEGGAERAAKTLREVTAGETPALAARMLQEAQPTIERIAAQLDNGGLRQTPPAPGDAQRNPLRSIYADQEVLADLSAVASRVGTDPANWPVIQQTAAALTRHMDGTLGKLAVFDGAFGFGVARGEGASLAIAVVDQLKAAGRVQQANAVLDDVGLAVGRLHQAVGRANGAYVEARRESLHLAANYGSWATDPDDPRQSEAVERFWGDYERAHPQLARTQEELDRVSEAAARTVVELKQREADFAGLNAAPRVQHNASQLINDAKVLDSILASPTARDYVANQPSLFSLEGAAKVLGLRASRDGRSFLQRIAIASVKGRMESAVRGMAAGDYAAVNDAISHMQKQSGFFGRLSSGWRGLSAERSAAVDAMLSALSEINRASAAGEDLKKGLDRFNAARTAFGDAAPTMNTSTLWGAAVRGWGLALSTLALAKQVAGNPEHEADHRRYLNEFYAAASTVQQAAMVGTGLAHRWDPHAKSVDRVARMALLDQMGDVLAGVGAMVEAVNAAANFRNGDLAGGALSSTSAFANYLLWQGYTTGADGARTGLLKAVRPFSVTPGFGLSGSALVRLGAWLGLVTAPITIGYEMHKEASKYETPTTENYLKALGFDAGTAHALTNHTYFSGRSPGPIFGQLAAAFGFNLRDPTDLAAYRTYLNSLSKEQITQAVRAAHEISPDRSGQYPDTAVNDADLLKPQEYIDTGDPESPTRPRYDHEPRSIQGLKNWLMREGYPLP